MCQINEKQLCDNKMYISICLHLYIRMYIYLIRLFKLTPTKFQPPIQIGMITWVPKLL